MVAGIPKESGAAVAAGIETGAVVIADGILDGIPRDRGAAIGAGVGSGESGLFGAAMGAAESSSTALLGGICCFSEILRRKEPTSRFTEFGVLSFFLSGEGAFVFFSLPPDTISARAGSVSIL